MAPEVGLEPTTDRLTADSSTIELLWNALEGGKLPMRFPGRQNVFWILGDHLWGGSLAKRSQGGPVDTRQRSIFRGPPGLGYRGFRARFRWFLRIPVDRAGPFQVPFQTVLPEQDHWNDLLRLAREEVSQVVEALPDDLRAHALEVPVTYESCPSEALLEDGWDPDLLGMFVGDSVGEPISSGVPLQILLFLENLWDFAEGDVDVFLEEVRVTYIHEFGHYLGLDEDQLEERGLL